jgi:hypothetical protein
MRGWNSRQNALIGDRWRGRRIGRRLIPNMAARILYAPAATIISLLDMLRNSRAGAVRSGFVPGEDEFGADVASGEVFWQGREGVRFDYGHQSGVIKGIIA